MYVIQMFRSQMRSQSAGEMLEPPGRDANPIINPPGRRGLFTVSIHAACSYTAASPLDSMDATVGTVSACHSRECCEEVERTLAIGVRRVVRKR